MTDSESPKTSDTDQYTTEILQRSSVTSDVMSDRGSQPFIWQQQMTPSRIGLLFGVKWRLVAGAIALSALPMIFLGVAVNTLLSDVPDIAVSRQGMDLAFPAQFGLLWLASFIMTTIGVGLFVSHWVNNIHDAVQHLTVVLQSLFQGNGCPPVAFANLANLAEPDELIRLTETINQIAEQLQTLQQERDHHVNHLQAMTDALEDRIGQRTAQLYGVITQLKQEIWERKQAESQLQQSQAQLIHSEKMSGLGQMVAGIAHEINNPVNFIHGNLKHVQSHVQDILAVLDMYQTLYPDPVPELKAIAETLDLEFLEKDLRKIVASMQIGTDRILGIVRSLRTFSRIDQVEFKPADIHEGIDSTLLILKHRLKARPNRPQIQVVKQYAAELPLVECHAGQINQVFMNILTNAIDALDEAGDLCIQKSEPPILIVSTRSVGKNWIAIQISDNGPGIPTENQARLFDPFFTTKPVGKGTGLGMSISYTIVTETHNGILQLTSSSGKGASFLIELPITQRDR